MATCSVLRCTNDSAKLRQTDAGEALPLQFLVCADHDREIESGVPYRYNFEDATVYMGKDIDVAGLRLLTGLSTIDEAWGYPAGTMRWNFADEHGETVSFLVNADFVKSLREWLADSFLLGSDEPDPE